MTDGNYLEASIDRTTAGKYPIRVSDEPDGENTTEWDRTTPSSKWLNKQKPANCNPAHPEVSELMTTGIASRTFGVQQPGAVGGRPVGARRHGARGLAAVEAAGALVVRPVRVDGEEAGAVAARGGVRRSPAPAPACAPPPAGGQS